MSDTGRSPDQPVHPHPTAEKHGLERQEEDYARIGSTLQWGTKVMRGEFQGSRAISSLTIDQVYVLNDLLYEPMSVRRIAQFRGIAYSTAGELVARLASGGLVERTQNQGSHSYIVRLTPQGQELAHEIRERIRNVMVRLTSPYTAERKERINRAISILKTLFPESETPERGRAS